MTNWTIHDTLATMWERALEKKLGESATNYPIVALLGPRQSGKTTLAKVVFPQKAYVTLENPDSRTLALEDPRRFLEKYAKGAILDEVQRAPEIFSYLQAMVDEDPQPGRFILTGSQNFALMEKITQSLAGRIAILKLLPFSLEEIKRGSGKVPLLHKLLFTGGYPRIYDRKLNPTDWYGNYVETYLEKDVRILKAVGNLATFHKFARMCAGRCGQLVNLSGLGNDCGITHNTAKSWLSIMEASFILSQIPPHYKNFNKRLKKSPKLYFNDTGLLCYLLGITQEDELVTHPMRGAIFETFVFNEIVKRQLNAGRRSQVFFWQDKLGREIDFLIEKGPKLVAIEAKAGQTLTTDSFKNLSFWSQLTHTPPHDPYLVYAGGETQDRKRGHVVSWKDLAVLPI